MDAITQVLWAMSLEGGHDEEAGDSTSGVGWAARFDAVGADEAAAVAEEQGIAITEEDLEDLAAAAGAIVEEDTHGFHCSSLYKDEAELERAWADTVADLEGAEEEDDDEPADPEDGDYTIEDARGGGVNVCQYGKVKATFAEEEDARAWVRADAEVGGFWPNVWRVSDHGNAHLVDDPYAKA